MPRCSPISSSQRARRNLTKFFSLPAQYIQPIQHPLLIERHFFRRGLSSQRLNLVYSQFLFRVDPHDVTTFFFAAALLLAVALVAGSVPGFRAAWITATNAMRQE
jgi:hypothetical protein